MVSPPPFFPGCTSCLSFPSPAGTSSTSTRCRVQPRAPAAARRNGPRSPNLGVVPVRSPSSPLAGKWGQPPPPKRVCPPPPRPQPGWGQADVIAPNRFRVSRIPETRSEAGGEPPRGPLPAGSGMRPPWLKSIDGPPEVKGCGGRVVGSPWEGGSFLGKMGASGGWGIEC